MPMVCLLRQQQVGCRGMGGRGEDGGGGQGKESCELRACSPEVSHDTEVSSLVVSTSSLGGRFQSLMVLGKNEVFLTCNAFLLWWAWTAHDLSAGERGGGWACHHLHIKVLSTRLILTDLLTYDLGSKMMMMTKWGFMSLNVGLTY